MDFTELLRRANEGDTEARAEAIASAYDRLRELAVAKMSDERQDHTLTSTALVHEVSLKLLHDADVPTASRGQFLAFASKAMRNYLIDHARTKGRQKRGGIRRRHSFEEAMVASNEQRDDFLALNAALEVLAKIEPRKAQVRNALFRRALKPGNCRRLGHFPRNRKARLGRRQNVAAKNVVAE